MATRSVSFLVALVSFLAAVSVKRAEARNYTVGDTTGWTVPPNSDFYDDWHDNKDFVVGDLLIFNWVGDHNVVEVTEAQYDACTNVTIGVRTMSPAVFILTTAGDYHFISTVGDSCLRGQKLEIDVDRAPLTTPAASPPPPPPATTSPPPMMAPPPAVTPVKAPAPAPASTGTATPPTSTATPGPAQSPASTGTTPPGSGLSPSSTVNTTSPPPSSGSPASFAPAVALSAAVLVGLFL